MYLQVSAADLLWGYQDNFLLKKVKTVISRMSLNSKAIFKQNLFLLFRLVGDKLMEASLGCLYDDKYCKGIIGNRHQTYHLHKFIGLTLDCKQ